MILSHAGQRVIHTGRWIEREPGTRGNQESELPVSSRQIQSPIRELGTAIDERSIQVVPDVEIASAVIRVAVIRVLIIIRVEVD